MSANEPKSDLQSAPRRARAERRRGLGPYLRRSCAAAVALALLAGCASNTGRRDPVLDSLRQGPGNTPQRNVTDFSAALRCMDDTLLAFGTRDIVVMVEELQDQTRRLGTGTRDMMISAFSDMTRRSRAIRLVTFGQDNFNIVSLMQQLEQRTPFGILPQYDIRGSISQFDEDVVKKDQSLGGALPNLFGLRATRATTSNVLGFDVNVVTVPGLVLIPGVTSKNTVIVTRDEFSAADGQATIAKVGLNFNMAVNRNAGVAQALRNMVELATVELTGKLARVPYWNCLGIPAGNPDVRREVEDWFFSLREGDDRKRFFQEHLRNRRFYDGPVDGKSSPALDDALAAYRVGLGRSAKGAFDLDFFSDFLSRAVPAAPASPFSTGPQPKPGADNPQAAAALKSAQGSAQGGSPAADGAATVGTGDRTTAVVTSIPTTPQVAVAPLKPAYKVGENIDFGVQANRSGYLYCYFQAVQDGPIQRIYPNRRQTDPRIEADELVVLPDGGFKLQLDRPGTARIACVAAPREIYKELPPPLRWGDFEDIKLKSFAAIREQFERAGGLPVAMSDVRIDIVR